MTELFDHVGIVNGIMIYAIVAGVSVYSAVAIWLVGSDIVKNCKGLEP